MQYYRVVELAELVTDLLIKKKKIVKPPLQSLEDSWLFHSKQKKLE